MLLIYEALRPYATSHPPPRLQPDARGGEVSVMDIHRYTKTSNMQGPTTSNFFFSGGGGRSSGGTGGAKAAGRGGQVEGGGDTRELMFDVCVRALRARLKAQRAFLEEHLRLTRDPRLRVVVEDEELQKLCKGGGGESEGAVAVGGVGVGLLATSGVRFGAC
jgi:hypothetical protein